MSRKLDQFEAVEEFMRAMAQEIPPTPQIPTAKVTELRAKLISEEVLELFDHLEKTGPRSVSKMTEDNKLDLLTDIADAIADVIYVVAGTAIAFGIPGSLVFDIVHAANMAKLDGPVREDGKRLKPEGWEAPEPKIRGLLERLRREYVPSSYENRSGVEWEGPQDATS